METPMLELCIDMMSHGCPHVPIQGDCVTRARAELAALRAAPPKIDGVPTVPGWYWARSSWRGWMCVEVRAELNGGELGFYGWGYVEEAQPLDLLKDYHGPLTPPKETT